MSEDSGSQITKQRQDFQEEAISLLNVLNDTLSKCENSKHTDKKPLEEFAKMITPILVHSEQLKEFQILDVCQMGKIIAQTYSNEGDTDLRKTAVEVLRELVIILQNIINLPTHKMGQHLQWEEYKELRSKMSFLSDKSEITDLRDILLKL